MVLTLEKDFGHIQTNSKWIDCVCERDFIIDTGGQLRPMGPKVNHFQRVTLSLERDKDKLQVTTYGRQIEIERGYKVNRNKHSSLLISNNELV